VEEHEAEACPRISVLKSYNQACSPGTRMLHETTKQAINVDGPYEKLAVQNRLGAFVTKVDPLSHRAMDDSYQSGSSSLQQSDVHKVHFI